MDRGDFVDGNDAHGGDGVALTALAASCRPRRCNIFRESQVCLLAALFRWLQGATLRATCWSRGILPHLLLL